MNSAWTLCWFVGAENSGSRYTEIGNRIGSDERGDRSKGDIIADITSSFVVLMGIFFPSVTGRQQTSSPLLHRPSTTEKNSTFSKYRMGQRDRNVRGPRQGTAS